MSSAPAYVVNLFSTFALIPLQYPTSLAISMWIRCIIYEQNGVVPDNLLVPSIRTPMTRTSLCTRTILDDCVYYYLK